MLSAYVFIIVIYSSWIESLILIYCPSLSFITVFVLKSILSDMSVAIPAFFTVKISHAGVQPQRIQGIRSGDCVGEGKDTIASIRY